jgi:UDP-glucuronate decarboxylase
LISDIVGKKLDLVRKPLPQDDPKQRKPDISLAERNLDWQPTIQLREGLEKTVSYFKDMLRTPTN